MSHIRRARWGDHQFANWYREVTIGKMRSQLRNHADGKIQWWIIEEADKPIGWAKLHLDSHETPKKPGLAVIEDLWVIRRKRSRGFGTRLLLDCERRAKAAGLTGIWLSVDPNHNQAARRLYERLGYVHDGGELYLDGVYGDFEEWVIDLVKPL
jgi:ribosomal protein S18 acetylase RimI-like enzyme